MLTSNMVNEGMMQPDKEALLEIYRRATLIKRADEKFVAQIRAGEIAIAYYSPRGQEVVAAATCVNLEPDDYLVTIYRGLHDHLAKGVPLKLLWAEFSGKIDGTCKGKGGPMHITHPASGVMVTTGIVGSGMPIANGLALASKMRRDGKVTVCCFGDGAANIGAFHEALNLASLWKLPVIFLCQNNRYSEHTTYGKGTSVKSVALRAASYDMPGLNVDGNDPVAMWSAVHEAVMRARNGEGPTLIEAMTFRFRGHSYGDAGEYIPKEEYQAAVEADPVPRLRAWLLAQEYASNAALEEIEAAIDKEIEVAVQFAKNSPLPSPEELRLDVYEHEVVLQ